MGAQALVEGALLGMIRMDATEARMFALLYDRNPVHVEVARRNAILPEDTVSGLYVVAKALDLLQVAAPDHTARVLCASKMSVRWLAPVIGDQWVSLRIETVIMERTSRIFLRLLLRVGDVPVAEIDLHQILAV